MENRSSITLGLKLRSVAAVLSMHVCGIVSVVPHNRWFSVSSAMCRLLDGSLSVVLSMDQRLIR
jgi:hypothetical protein